MAWPRKPDRGDNHVRSPFTPARRGGVRTLAVCAAATALAAAPLGAARAAGTDDTVKVTYRGHEFTVPASWPIVDLEKHPDVCVRFDRHAVYLGTPGDQQQCPAAARDVPRRS